MGTAVGVIANITLSSSKLNPGDLRLQVSPYENEPCHPCDCDPVGSLSSVCIKDDLHSEIHNGKYSCPFCAFN